MKTLNKIQDEAYKIGKIIAKKYQPKKIILFGSVARGDIQNSSDIDLCIIKDTNIPFRKRIWEVYKLLRDENYNYGVEPIVFTSQEFEEKKKKNFYFIRNILKDGKIIYES